LMGMINYAVLIADRTDNSEIRSFAEEIRREGDRVARIVRTLLRFAHREPEAMRPASLTGIVSDALTLVGAILRQDGIRVSVEIPDSLPLIPCQRHHIEQVLINLLNNARDALNQRFPKGSDEKVLVVTAAERVAVGKRSVRVTVEDRGAGIDPVVRERIFDPFFTTKPKEVGTGLGLSISYGIVRDHGGRLTVESESNSWTQFHVDLPLDDRSRVSPDQLPDGNLGAQAG